MLCLRSGNQGLLVGAVSGQHEYDVRAGSELRRLEYHLEPLGQPMGAGVEKDLFAVEAERVGQPPVARLWVEGPHVDAIRQKNHLVARQTALGQRLQDPRRRYSDAG